MQEADGYRYQPKQASALAREVAIGFEEGKIGGEQSNIHTFHI